MKEQERRGPREAWEHADRELLVFAKKWIRTLCGETTPPKDDARGRVVNEQDVEKNK